MTPTRRQLLAGLGATGALALGTRSVGAGDPRYTQYTYAQTDDTGVDLRVAWYERYNGVRQERTPDSLSLADNQTWIDAAQNGSYVNVSGGADEVVVDTDPVLNLANVLPGDSGVVVFGLRNEGDPARVTLRAFGPDGADTPVFAENGVNEPESAVDATAGGEGELGEAVSATVWYDDGLLDTSVWAGDGAPSPTEKVLLSGSLGSVLDALSVGIDLDDYGCLGSDAPHYLGFAWSLPADVGNEVQSDSAAFSLSFTARACESAEVFQ